MFGSRARHDIGSGSLFGLASCTILDATLGSATAPLVMFLHDSTVILQHADQLTHWQEMFTLLKEDLYLSLNTGWELEHSISSDPGWVGNSFPGKAVTQSIPKGALQLYTVYSFDDSMRRRLSVRSRCFLGD
eukprot:1558693-Amphidinium_carterae.1